MEAKTCALLLLWAACLSGCAPPPREREAAQPVPRRNKAPEYSFKSLGTLGGNFSYPNDLNEAGAVVGNSCTWGNCDDRAFVFSGGRIRQIGNYHDAKGIINDGSILCIGSMSDGTMRAALCRKGQTVPIRFAGVWPAAINDRGDIAGTLSLPGQTRHACLIRNGRLVDLGTLGGKDSYASGISESGYVVGSSDWSGRLSHAFLWSNGKMRDLGAPAGEYSIANRVNDRGQVVGNVSAGPAIWHAFLWERGKMTDLGTLGGRSSDANDINSKGDIVGNADDASDRVRAFRFRNGKMQDLNDLVDSSCDGWELSVATAINDRGQIAVVASKPGSMADYAGILTPLNSRRPKP
jgi:probable HAF family extracellular repeat protein